MIDVDLNANEIEALFRQPTETKQDGGFQSLLIKLQTKTDMSTGKLQLTDDDLERIPRYAFDHKNGGWQNRLRSIFGRVLGPDLGRQGQTNG